MALSRVAQLVGKGLSSILTKCMIGMALVVIIIDVIAVTRENAAKVDLLRSELVARATEVTTLLAMQSGGSIKFGNKAALSEIVGKTIETAKPSALGSIVVNAEAAILHETAAESFDKALALSLAEQALAAGTVTASDDGLIVAVPAVFGSDGAAVGVVVTSWTDTRLLAKLRATQSSTFLLSGLLLLCALALMGIFLWFYMARPLGQFGGAMKRIASKDYRTAVPFTGRSDEVGRMARSLDQFREKLGLAEASQRESAFKSAAFEGSSAPMMVVDEDFVVTFINPSCERLLSDISAGLTLRWPSEGRDGWMGASLAHMEDLADVVRDIQRDGISALPASRDIRLGHQHLQITVSAALDHDQSMIGAVIEWSDRTESQHNSAILQAIDSNQVRLEFDASGRCVQANAVAQNVLGLPKEEHAISRVKFDAIFTTKQSDSAISSDFERAVLSGKPLQAQFDARDVSSGAARVLDGAFAGVTDADGTAERSLFLGADVTEAQTKMRVSEKERAQVAEQQEKVVTALREALQSLSEGDLTAEIVVDFPDEYEILRQNYNAAVVALREAIARVMQNSESIRHETSEITSAADDLSRRTERQAATLEETATALDELTTSVRSAAESADAASKMSAEAQQNAEQGGAVAREAVAAMDGIKTSSQEISKITSVIDDIAFQTNLLALNAGVEAARAGEAGRGFAVVATEVRALAQRSSDAAREINELISASGDQVREGVDLVDRTGDALSAIVRSVADISERVAAIATSTREQSNGLGEVNTAVNELDHVTQQNAAMFEETTAASHALTSEADGLASAVAAFKLGKIETIAKPTSAARKSPSTTSTPAPKERPSMPLTSGSLALSAPDPQGADEGWEEF